MGAIYNAEEIFRIAEQIERNGAAFYEKAAERFEGEARRRLNGLSAMERVHEQQFTSMRKEIFEDASTNALPDPDGEVQKYLAAFADGKIFAVDSDPTELLAGMESIGEILRLAIQLEKDSVVFYAGIREAVPGSLGRDKVDNIIKEEMSHISLLSEALSSLDE
jgi:rubrerythrin